MSHIWMIEEAPVGTKQWRPTHRVMLTRLAARAICRTQNFDWRPRLKYRVKPYVRISLTPLARALLDCL